MAKIYFDGEYIGETDDPVIICRCNVDGTSPDELKLGHWRDAWGFLGDAKFPTWVERPSSRIMPEITVRRKSFEDFFRRVRKRIEIT